MLARWKEETSRKELCRGDLVEVLGPGQILATLDDQGALGGLPFMPEMAALCGQRFTVDRRADRVCDTVHYTGSRRLSDAVLLDDLRCNGSGHDGCQAECRFFWKEEWLRRVRPETPPAPTFPQGDLAALVERCARNTRVPGPVNGEGLRYRCQATELVEATTPLRRWDPRPYLKDLASGNVRFLDFVRYVAIAAFNAVMRMHWRGRPYPYIRGLAEGPTPNDVLNLQPGEMVQVRSKNEIMRTINENQKNRGLWFDVEMVPYCDRTFQVLRRVETIINEKTGKMMRLPNACLVLADVTCGGCLSQHRLFCPRGIYPFWREVWLKRVGKPALNSVTSSA